MNEPMRESMTMDKPRQVFIERREGALEGVLHVVEACPDLMILGDGAVEAQTVDDVSLGLLRARHPVCQTCQDLEVAASADRVRYLLASLTRR